MIRLMDSTQAGNVGPQADIRSVLDALWRRKWLFLSIFITIPAVVYVISSTATKTYEAFALIQTNTTTLNVAGLPSSSLSSIGSEALLIDTNRIGRAAAKNLGEPPSQGVALTKAVRGDPVTTSTGGETDLIQLTARATTGRRAMQIANAYAKAVDQVRTRSSLRQIDTAISKLETQSANAGTSADQATSTGTTLSSQLQELRAARTAAQQSTQVMQAARPPGSPVSPRPIRNTVLAAVVSLLLGLGAVALRERLDRRLRSSEELEPLLGAPLLSVIPRAAFPGARPAPAAVRESFRTLAASLLYFNVDRQLSTVLITSPTKGDGKTTVAVYLAIALAKDGQNVVLIDADLRHPQVGVRLGIEPRIGLSEVLTGQGHADDALVRVDVGDGDQGGRLRVLAAGRTPPNPARLLISERMSSLRMKLAEEADIVVIDTPPLLNVSDAVPLLESVSGTVIVAKVGTTTRDALRRTRQVIDTARGSILGIVATGSSQSGMYGYGGAYYQEAEEAGDAVTPTVVPEAAPAQDGAGSDNGAPATTRTEAPRGAAD
jgi:succinoglycan biosynthesis transport protein ExoP